MIATAVFVSFSCPGDPAALCSLPSTESQVELLRTTGSQQPISSIHWYLQSLLRGDLGISTSYSQPVTTVILGRSMKQRPAHLSLITTSIGIAGGVMAAVGGNLFWRGPPSLGLAQLFEFLVWNASHSVFAVKCSGFQLMGLLGW